MNSLFLINVSVQGVSLMMKKIFKRQLKKILYSILAITLFCINSFAAIVADNDGGAFVTKAEFDNLKIEFENQISRYNNSIDSKIDGAIANYLAGVRIPSPRQEQFYDGEGQNVLIFDSSKVNDLKRGKVEIDFNSMVVYTTDDHSAYPGLNTTSKVSMSRTTSEPFEVFAINKESDAIKEFKFWNNNYKFRIKANFQYCFVNAYSYFTATSDFRIRWHGAGNYPTNNHKCSLKDTKISNCERLDYSYYLSSNGFWSIDTSGILHTFCWNISNKCPLEYTSSTELVDNDDKIEYVMDRAYDDTTIWGCFNGNVPETTAVYANDLVGYDTTGTFVYDTPGASGTDIITTGTMDYTCNANVAGGNLSLTTGYIDSVSWTKNGKFNDVDSPTDSSLPWVEPLVKLFTQSPKTMIHSAVPERILTDYNSYGWTGKLTEGLPINIFKEPGKVEFELDTTNLNRSSVFAISKTPFNTSSTSHLIDTPASAGIKNFKIDGTTVTGGAKEISSGKHKIQFEVDGDKSYPIPVFFKIEYPQSETGSIRRVVALPKEYRFSPM